MFQILVYAILPIAVVMAGGYLAGRAGAFTGDNARILNKVVLDYALPAALFASIVRADRDMLVADIPLTVAAVVSLMLCFFLVYWVFRGLFRDSGAEAAVSALISGSPSIGFLGFAVLQPVFGVTPRVGLVIAIVAITVNALGIPAGMALLYAGQGRRAPGGPGAVVRALGRPVVWAPLAAVLLVVCGIPWPQWLMAPLDLIAGANASVAVFAAGITLSSVRLRINRQVITGSVLKLVVMPAMALGAGLLAGLDLAALRMLVTCAVLPPPSAA